MSGGQRLALAYLGLSPVIGLMAGLFSHLTRDAFRNLQGHLGHINARLRETLTGFMAVKRFQAEEQGWQKFKRLTQDYYQSGMRQIKVVSIFMPLTELFASLTVGLSLWIRRRPGGAGQTDPGHPDDLFHLHADIFPARTRPVYGFQGSGPWIPFEEGHLSSRGQGQRRPSAMIFLAQAAKYDGNQMAGSHSRLSGSGVSHHPRPLPHSWTHIQDPG
ncbi:hypothetical protein DFAR_2010002 [Desulfarculales bacterium]